MAVREFKPAVCGADVRDWISPEDVIRIALAAYYGESRLWDSPPDPELHFPSDHPSTWYSRREFADGLGERIYVRIMAEAHKAGVACDPHAVIVAERMEKCVWGVFHPDEKLDQERMRAMQLVHPLGGAW